MAIVGKAKMEYIILHDGGYVVVETAPNSVKIKEKLAALNILYPGNKYVVYTRYNV